MPGNDPLDNGSDLSMGVQRFFSRLTTPLYAVIDTARDRRALSLLEDADCDYQILHPPRLSLAMDRRGPHLILLRPDSFFFNRLIHAGWGNSWGIFLAGPSDIATVRRHLRRLLFVTLQDGQRFMFRFYDPRVLREFLPNSSERELRLFFGPLTAIYLESRDGREVACYSLERSRETEEHLSCEGLREYKVKLT
ncbi:hypothetical protein GMST_07380 [Geomonas silvestris]|uniref:DUF4123 domain-containing protein n=1 Tax=Geomonas silvestris TaxID=2740184 RepID=A0A6V8MF36_9BACT|nr:DUF4123 domain-containing protein [Geomonas silvestris]GFO58413.1 hypothetical protein GMST_07380 [Geomonas silvestris]